MSAEYNGKRYLWATVLSAVLNVVLFGYISLGFVQEQEAKGLRPVERDVAYLIERADEQEREIKAIAVSLEAVRQQLAALRCDVAELKEVWRREMGQ